MKIALISQTLDRVTPPVMNSIGIWTYETARRLAKSNEVTVYTRGGLATGPGIGQKVRTRYIRTMPNRWLSRVEKMADQFSRPKRPFFASYFYNLEYSLQIALEVRRLKYDVVHIQNYSQFVPIIRALNPRTKIALHMRCEWLTQLDHAMIARRLAKTDLIFGVSNYITNKIRKAFPEYSQKCFTVANGVDVEAFAPPANPPGNEQRVILMVGRVSPEKGIHVLIEAFRGLADRFPDIQLVLVGSIVSVNKGYIVEISDEAGVNSLGVFYQGNYRDQLNALLPAELRQRVHFQGNVGYYDTIDFYRRSYMLVNPSISEAFGRSLIEGNACGLPVVAARAGGMTEIIQPGYNGLLVEPGNASELAAAMERLLADEPLRQEMGVNGRQHVLEHYTWDKICGDLMKVYCK